MLITLVLSIIIEIEGHIEGDFYFYIKKEQTNLISILFSNALNSFRIRALRVSEIIVMITELYNLLTLIENK